MIMKASQVWGGIKFKSNSVKFTGSNGLWFEECRRVSVVNNAFLMNFKGEADGVGDGKQGKAQKEYVIDFTNLSEKLKNPSTQLHKLKRKIEGSNRVLIRSNKSNMNLNGNKFQNNDGQLILIEEKVLQWEKNNSQIRRPRYASEVKESGISNLSSKFEHL